MKSFLGKHPVLDLADRVIGRPIARETQRIDASTATISVTLTHYDLAFVEICSLTIALMAVVEIIRVRIIGNIRQHLLDAPVAALEKASAGSYHDMVFFAAVATVFVVLCIIVKNHLMALRAVRITYVICCIIVVAIYICHIAILKYIGQPFTYQWLYYSEFLGSMEAKQAIWANVSVALLLIVAACATIFASLFLLMRRVLALAVAASGSAVVSAALLLAMVSYGAWARVELNALQLPYAKVANPILAFVGSLTRFSTPLLYTYPTKVDTSEFEPLARPQRTTGIAANGARTNGHIKNVLFYVFESTPATLTSFYGGPYPTTPELDRRRGQSLAFENAYAHSPTTNTSLVSLLTSSYPWVTAKFITAEHPDIRLTPISTELKKRGYRTGFFNSADLRFQSADRFIEYQNFDAVMDDRSIPCSLPVNATSSAETFSSMALPYLDGVDDGCTADALIQWLGQDPGRSFFAVMWTMMTHYPYPPPRQVLSFAVEDKDLHRYLNVLHHGDRELGRVLDELERLGIADSTLVVILGDHGEAFGEHGFRGHGSSIYEQSVHIPLVVINRLLFHGEKNQAVGGLADIAPTVMDILGLRPGDTWQGRSLLDKNRPQRTYFFAPWSDLYFGYREGNLKCLFNATRNTIEIYDLAKDPGENENLFSPRSDAKEKVLNRLAAWVQYQDRFVRTLTSPPQNETFRPAR
jgi:arylsulfatase A-like enzyme